MRRAASNTSWYPEYPSGRSCASGWLRERRCRACRGAHATRDRNSPGRRPRTLDPERHFAAAGAADLAYDLFIGIPTHHVPPVVEASGPTAGGVDGRILSGP
ncbi:hypothetical protein [Nocardia sp. NPDC052112]|uniref:hypothetical protein n=1 Tax=Nocardia sp. NPDC052112 TaxID=3155646 RepID=UPI003425084D